MPLTPSDAIEVKRVRGKGRGVFARRSIEAGEVIETCPVLVLPADSVEDVSAGIGGYVFEWGHGKLALALGYGSLYNHSYRPNARYVEPAQRPLGGPGRADQAVHGAPGHRGGRGDHGQLQRRAGG